jgi:hypothetical protein
MIGFTGILRLVMPLAEGSDGGEGRNYQNWTSGPRFSAVSHDLFVSNKSSSGLANDPAARKPKYFPARRLNNSHHGKRRPPSHVLGRKMKACFHRLGGSTVFRGGNGRKYQDAAPAPWFGAVSPFSDTPIQTDWLESKASVLTV